MYIYIYIYIVYGILPIAGINIDMHILSIAYCRNDYSYVLVCIAYGIWQE